MQEKFKKYLCDPYFAIGELMMKIYPNLMSDKFFLNIRFQQTFGRYIDWDNPKTFNEKLNWMKVYDCNPLYTTLVDKYEAKKWVANKIGEEYIIPTIAVYDDVESIDWEKLQANFVIKCTHDSGSVIICKNKTDFNISKAKTMLSRWLSRNFYWQAREWAYKNVHPRIIVEKYLPFTNGILMDYRIYCFEGKPQFIYAYTNHEHQEGLKPEPSSCDYFDINWNPLDFRQHYHPSGVLKRPRDLNKMLEFASKIAENLPFARVDFYDAGHIYFSEITLYPGGGFSKFVPEEYDDILGKLILLKIQQH